MKNILLFAHDDTGQEARLQSALDITRAVDGHLTCLDVERPPVYMADYYTTAGSMIADIDEHAREVKNATHLKARLEHEDVRWNWIDASGDIADCLTKHAGLADAVVVNSGVSGSDIVDIRSIATSVAAGVHGAVVAIPESCKRFDVLGKAIVAWDGSPPAMAAMRAAVPLLALASSVEIFNVDDGSEQRSAEEAASYLSYYDIHASIRRIKDGLIAADEHIRLECTQIGAAYCVMGTYGHSRFRETLFGGVTRRMLAKSEIPVVLSH